MAAVRGDPSWLTGQSAGTGRGQQRAHAPGRRRTQAITRGVACVGTSAIISLCCVSVAFRPLSNASSCYDFERMLHMPGLMQSIAFS